MSSGVTGIPTPNSMITTGNTINTVPQQTPLSFGEKFKTYTKAGLAGIGAGLPAGMIQSATHAMHIPQVGRPIANEILHAGDMKAVEIGQTGVVNHNLNYIDNNLKSLEPTNYTPIIEKTSIPETGQNAPIIMNPGEMVNEMDYVSTGRDIIENPSLQQEYLEMQQRSIPRFAQLQPGVQASANERIMEQLHQHPGSAGKMFESTKSIEARLKNNSGSANQF